MRFQDFLSGFLDDFTGKMTEMTENLTIPHSNPHVNKVSGISCHFCHFCHSNNPLISTGNGGGKFHWKWRYGKND